MLKLFYLIEKISGRINNWSRKKIRRHQPMAKWKMDIIKSMGFAVIGILLFIFIVSLFFPKNIQEIKIKKPIKEIEIKVETPEKKEYKRLKTHFAWLEEEVYNFIKIEAEKEKIDPVYVLSVIDYESAKARGNNWEKMQIAVSRAGARGIMQIMPFHAKNPDDLFKWKYNIKKGIWYLGACLEASGGDIRQAARRYNQGIHGNPRRYRNWRYVARIAKKYKRVLTDKVMVAGNE